MRGECLLEAIPGNCKEGSGRGAQSCVLVHASDCDCTENGIQGSREVKIGNRGTEEKKKGGPGEDKDKNEAGGRSDGERSDKYTGS